MHVSLYSARFQSDLKRCKKRDLDLRKLEKVIYNLENEIPLNRKYRVHALHGEYEGQLECHIEPDWLLIYGVDHDKKEIYLARTGTHSDLF